MSLISLTQYAVMGGDAVGLLCNWFASNSGNIDTTTLDISWSPGAAPDGGSFVLTANARIGPNTYSTTIHVTEWHTGVVIPIQLAIQWNAWSRNQNFAFNELTNTQVQHFTDELWSARIEAIESVTGATVAANLTHDHTFSGKSFPFIHWNTVMFVTATAVCIDTMAIMNQNYYSSGQTVGQNYSPQNNQGLVTVVGGQGGSGNGNPLDLDVSINNAANIFSVISRTFTEPGS